MHLFICVLFFCGSAKQDHIGDSDYGPEGLMKHQGIMSDALYPPLDPYLLSASFTLRDTEICPLHVILGSSAISYLDVQHGLGLAGVESERICRDGLERWLQGSVCPLACTVWCNSITLFGFL